MPTYRTLHVNDHTTIGIWKVTETEAFLWKGVELTTHCQERFDGMRSAAHRAAFLSIRHLLMAQGYTDKDLCYDERGKPHLKDGSYISISHSHSFTAVIISHRREVGIDIEKQRDKILRIAHKFTPVAEYRTLANTTALVRKLTWVWGAKESLYKIHGTAGLSFLKHISVDDFDMDQNHTTAHVHYEGTKTEYAVFLMEFEGYGCVYAFPTD